MHTYTKKRIDMRIITIGSCIGIDIVKLSNFGWKIEKNFTSYSPFAILKGISNNINLPDCILSDVNKELCERLRYNFNGKIISDAKKINPDIVLVDLSDLRIPVDIFELSNGNNVIITHYPIDKSILNKIKNFIEVSLSCKIIGIKSIYFSSLSQEKKADIVYSFIHLLWNTFSQKKVVFFKPRLVNQFIDSKNISGGIQYTKDFKTCGNINKLIDEIYGIAKNICSFIDSPKNIIGDSSILTPFEFHFCKPYYDYMANAIYKFVYSKIDNFDVELENCERSIHRLYNRIFCEQIIAKLGSNLKKKIVLIAKTTQFAEILLEKHNKSIYSYIEYNQSSDMSIIEKQIFDMIHKNSEDLIFVVPEYFRHCDVGLHTIFYKNRMLYGRDYISPNYIRTLLEKYNGIYEDIYNNRFVINSSMSIRFEGAGISLEIGEKVSPLMLLIFSGAHCSIGDRLQAGAGSSAHIWFDSYLSIKNDVTMVGGELSVPSFARMSIGNDVMMSNKEMIFSGDGHVIFLKKEGKYELINDCMKDEIVIGDHVWIGYGCKILSGANIGTGSIVGAGSLVNKKFPNNVLIAGIPAKIIRRNIAWSRNVLITKIEQDQNVFNNYANETVELH